MKGRLLEEFHPEAIKDDEFVIRKQAGRSKVAAQILQTETLRLIEAKLTEIIGRQMVLSVREAAVAVPVKGGLENIEKSAPLCESDEESVRRETGPKQKSKPEKEKSVGEATDDSEFFSSDSPEDYEERLRIAMEQAKPRREKLKDLMHDDPEMERAVRLVSETFNGRVVGLDGDPL